MNLELIDLTKEIGYWEGYRDLAYIFGSDKHIRESEIKYKEAVTKLANALSAGAELLKRSK